MSGPQPPLRLTWRCLIAALLLIAGDVALAARVPDPALPGYNSVYVVGAALPLLGVLGLLAAGSYEIALGGAVAFGGLFLARVLVWIGVVMSGYFGSTAPTSYVTLVSQVVHASLAPVLVLLVNAAFRAHRELPPLARRPGAWRLGLGCGLLAMGLWIRAPWYFLVDDTRERVMRATEAAAQEGLARLTRCAAAYAIAQPERGFPTALAALGPDGTRCLDATTAAGTSPGYRISYVAGVPDRTGAVPVYVACAQPIDTRESSPFTYVVDERATIVRGVPGDVKAIDAGLPLGCAATWFRDNDVERGVKHCVLEWAAAHPDAGYPASLRAIDPAGAGCLELLGTTPVSADALDGFQGIRGYRAGDPDERGIIRDFTLDLAARPPTVPGRRSR